MTTATRLFWRGYEQTSLTELTDALGISPASLYLAFESKEGLFRRVVDRYVEFRDVSFDRAFAAPTIMAGVAAMLEAYIDVLCDDAHAPGCLLVNNTLATASGSPLHRWLLDHRNAVGEKLEQQFLREIQAGRLPANFDASEMARFVVVLAGGLALEAKAGTRPETLRRMAELGVQSLQTHIARLGAE